MTAGKVTTAFNVTSVIVRTVDDVLARGAFTANDIVRSACHNAYNKKQKG